MAENVADGSLEIDRHWMAQALSLAQSGIGLASPNPTVGCVIVRDGRLVGSGFHDYKSRDHAEIAALREAGDQARGATAYVTLEPCSHHGRTGPCADALVVAAISRVVVATPDANPDVYGRGLEKLRDAGIEVVDGVLKEPARRLNDAFAKYIRTGLPYVTLKAAVTLDGRIAPPRAQHKDGEIHWITGRESREQVQRLRHSVDAVLTGIGTVLADDPLLTDRSGLERRRPLLRVVLDSKLRLPPESKLVSSSELDVLVFCADPPRARLQELTAACISVRDIAPARDETQPSLRHCLEELGQMQMTSVMIEAGSRLNAAFLKAGLVDRLYLFYAPRFLGADAEPLLSFAAREQPALRVSTLHRFGEDFAVEASFNDPWEP